jgi:hypothetical protein
MVFNNIGQSNIYECWIREVDALSSLSVKTVPPADQSTSELNGLQNNRYFAYMAFAQNAPSSSLSDGSI